MTLHFEHLGNMRTISEFIIPRISSPKSLIKFTGILANYAYKEFMGMGYRPGVDPPTDMPYKRTFGFDKRFLNVTEQLIKAWPDVRAVLEIEVITTAKRIAACSHIVSRVNGKGKRKRGVVPLEASNPEKFRLYERIVKAVEANKVSGEMGNAELASEFDTSPKTVALAKKWAASRLARTPKKPVKKN